MWVISTNDFKKIIELLNKYKKIKSLRNSGILH
jgi:hypothetical protein